VRGAIVDRMPADELKMVPGRLPVGQIEALREWADWHGYTFQDELKIAVGIHLRTLFATELATDRGRAQAKAQGLDPNAERSRILSELDQLKAAAYAAPERLAPSLSES
jgi:hypothetical protein